MAVSTEDVDWRKSIVGKHRKGYFAALIAELNQKLLQPWHVKFSSKNVVVHFPCSIMEQILHHSAVLFVHHNLRWKTLKKFTVKYFSCMTNICQDFQDLNMKSLHSLVSWGCFKKPSN